MKKMISKAAFCLPLFLFFLAFQSKAQSLEDIKTQMLKDWERAKSYTMDYLNKMPADKYSFKAVDSIRSFAQQMLHLSQGNCYLMSTATDRPMPAAFKADLEHSPGCSNKRFGCVLCNGQL